MSAVDASTTEPPAAPLRTESFRKERPTIVGEEVPEEPFPIRLSGTIQRGFGRGGRDLGIHTGLSSSTLLLKFTRNPQISSSAKLSFSPI